MKKLLLILATSLILPAGAQTPALKGGVESAGDFKSVNNRGVDCMGRGDYTNAEQHLKNAYGIARATNNIGSMRTSLGNLSTLYRITGKADQQGRMQAMLGQLNQSMLVGQPCTECWHMQQQALQAGQVELLNMQNNFDRQTFREDNSTQMALQDMQLRAEREQAIAERTRQQEARDIANQQSMTRATMGTSYFSRVKGF